LQQRLNLATHDATGIGGNFLPIFAVRDNLFVIARCSKRFPFYCLRNNACTCAVMMQHSLKHKRREV